MSQPSVKSDPKRSKPVSPVKLQKVESASSSHKSPAHDESSISSAPIALENPEGALSQSDKNEEKKSENGSEEAE